MILFLIALCVAPFYEVFCFVFSPFSFYVVCFLRLFNSSFPLWGSILCSTLQGSFNLSYFTFFPVFLLCLFFWGGGGGGDPVWLMVS